MYSGAIFKPTKLVKNVLEAFKFKTEYLDIRSSGLNDEL
jgi:hypothetical protein